MKHTAGVCLSIAALSAVIACEAGFSEPGTTESVESATLELGSTRGGFGMKLHKVPGRDWYIEEVQTSSPAEAAGLAVGDFVTKIDGVSIAGFSQFQLDDFLSGYDENDSVSVVFTRGGSGYSTTVTLGDYGTWAAGCTCRDYCGSQCGSYPEIGWVCGSCIGDEGTECACV